MLVSSIWDGQIKPLFLVCLLLLVSLFASNSYANELPVLDLLAFPEDGCFDVKEDGQCNWIYTDEAVYVEEWKAGTKNGQRTYTFADGKVTPAALGIALCKLELGFYASIFIKHIAKL